MMTVASRGFVVVTGALFLVCLAEFSHPTENRYGAHFGVTAPMSADTVARYAIPAGAAQGELRVMSYGVVDVRPANASAPPLHALHLRAIVQNDSTANWTFDTREQLLDLGRSGPCAPAFAATNPGKRPPLVTVAPHGTRVVDLFFPLPPDVQDGADLPPFDAITRVNTGRQVAVERTPFQRLVGESVGYGEYDYGADSYWGPPYWYNPIGIASGFGGALVIGPSFVEPVLVRHGSSAKPASHAPACVN
jgi:hypothetical protein